MPNTMPVLSNQALFAANGSSLVSKEFGDYLEEKGNATNPAKPARAGDKWEKEEDEKLTIGYKNGKTIDILAKEHQRSNTAIRSRLKKLEIYSD